MERVRRSFRNWVLAVALTSLPLQGSGDLGGLLQPIICAPIYVLVYTAKAVVAVFHYSSLGLDYVSSRSVDGVGVQSRAGVLRSVDCQGVEDEFQLYQEEVLKSPRMYIETLDGGLSEVEFEALSRDSLRLQEDFAGTAIGVVHTDAGNEAKFLFEFTDGDDDQRAVRLREVTVRDPATGERVHYLEGPLDMPPRIAIDLDPTVGEEGPKETTEGHDLVYAPDKDGVLLLVPGNGASFSVPTQSLCAGPTRSEARS